MIVIRLLRQLRLFVVIVEQIITRDLHGEPKKLNYGYK